MLDAIYKTDRARFEQLTARIHSLCTVIDYTQEMTEDWSDDYLPQGSYVGENKGNNDLLWNLFPHMVNLETLELHAEWLGQHYDPTPFDGKLPTPPRLRFAKLFGHFAQEFARYVVLGSAPTLKRLELGLLVRPVSEDWQDRPDLNAPLPSDRVDGAEASSHGSFVSDDDNGDTRNNADNEYVIDGDSSSDYGSVSGREDCVMPRPLGILLPRGAYSWVSGLDQSATVTFSKLKHLYLCKPIEGWADRSYDMQMKYSS